MCDVLVSKKAIKTLKSIGCNRKRFLRITANRHSNFQGLIDSQLHPTDEIVFDKTDIRVVGTAADIAVMNGLKIDFDSVFTFSR